MQQPKINQINLEENNTYDLLYRVEGFTWAKYDLNLTTDVPLYLCVCVCVYVSAAAVCTSDLAAYLVI